MEYILKYMDFIKVISAKKKHTESLDLVKYNF